MQRPRWPGTFLRAPADPGTGALREARKNGESDWTDWPGWTGWTDWGSRTDWGSWDNGAR
ncbi:hypothetical protein SSP531S_44720 [Streptomyces spongiicola]|uniref:Uncharacterized protein n=1 Tax=Streptomyces spongiicola TaxID=1690221 RepID=A0A388T256_9ACTN|nr:hypothetical protein [Streptomyces spongiicola]GBQ03007.1 hypothetical protein SSP531S_44720 [Streptomyces spongiicola]